MSDERFADRLDAQAYHTDPLAGVYRTDPDEDSALLVPERLLRRLTYIAKAYDLHSAALLGDNDTLILNKPMIESFIGELDSSAPASTTTSLGAGRSPWPTGRSRPWPNPNLC